MSKLRRPRFLVFYILIPIAFLIASSSEEQFRIAVPIIGCGVLIRLWANGYVGHRKVNWTQKWRGDAKVGKLITAGPYAYVRHPLYAGTLIIAAGFSVIIGQWLLAAVALTALAALYHYKMNEEERTLADECGGEFGRYSQAVGRWWPRLKAYAPQQGTWSWEGLAASREWKTVLWVVVGLIGFYLREEWWQEGELPFGPGWVKQVLFIALAVALMTTDAVIEFIRRRRRA